MRKPRHIPRSLEKRGQQLRLKELWSDSQSTLFTRAVKLRSEVLCY